MLCAHQSSPTRGIPLEPNNVGPIVIELCHIDSDHQHTKQTAFRWGQWHTAKTGGPKMTEMRKEKRREKNLTMQKEIEKSSTDQNSQAGGKEGRGEINDLTPCWIDAKRCHCQVGSTT